MKHLIFSGHTRINPHLLEVVLKDTPVCQGKSELRLCDYSLDCRRKCYESYSRDCKIKRYYDLVKSKYDKFGANLR